MEDYIEDLIHKVLLFFLFSPFSVLTKPGDLSYIKSSCKGVYIPEIHMYVRTHGMYGCIHNHYPHTEYVRT